MTTQLYRNCITVFLINGLWFIVEFQKNYYVLSYFEWNINLKISIFIVYIIVHEWNKGYILSLEKEYNS